MIFKVFVTQPSQKLSPERKKWCGDLKLCLEFLFEFSVRVLFTWCSSNGHQWGRQTWGGSTPQKVASCFDKGAKPLNRIFYFWLSHRSAEFLGKSWCFVLWSRKQFSCVSLNDRHIQNWNYWKQNCLDDF